MNGKLQALRGSLISLLINLTLCAVLVWGLRDPRETALRVEPAPTPRPAPSATPVQIHVHVSGAVRSPGLVRLGEGARVADALAAAGGLSRDASESSVNLAAPLADGQQLWVPEAGEAASSGPAMVIGGAVGSAPGTAGTVSMAGASGGGVSGSGGGGGGLRLNQATASELESLPGIGPALAARIVAHRESEGPFQAVGDLLEVSGIGEKTLERFANQLVVP